MPSIDIAEKHYYLVYLSSCAEDISETELLNILIQSFHNNERDNVASMLIHRPGQFLQVFEGNQQAINDVYQRVQADNRHFDINLVDSGFKAEHFCSEFMGLRYEGSSYPKSFRNWFDEGFNPSTLAKYRALMYSFLRSIGKNQPDDYQSKEYQHYKMLG